MSKHPTPEKLDEYASGSLDEAQRAEVANHIEACAHCAKKVRDSQRLASVLHAGLTSADSVASTSGCLPASMLADYFDGLLSPERKFAAEQHLAECPSCRENLVEIQKSLEKHGEQGFPALDEEIREKTLDLIGSEFEERISKCLSCGKEIEAGDQECPDCGAKIRPGPAVLLCMSCRHEIPTDSRFCPICGVAIAPPKKSLLFLFARRQGITELLRAHIWFLLGLAAMTASFFVRRYFMQCIAIAVIFGAKWILDQAHFRIYNDILKSLKKDSIPEEQAKTRKRNMR